MLRKKIMQLNNIYNFKLDGESVLQIQNGKDVSNKHRKISLPAAASKVTSLIKEDVGKWW